MRLDYIFFRYSRIAIIYYWPIAQNPDETPERRQHAQKAVNTFTRLIKEALDEQGIWSNENAN
ncbi:hypothetical protein BK004_03030 [bacterium CG10_46_32]|nr:MAG: hypothetical protein BK004_03030 [bacterium CG10_46_32]PIR56032.1 MAG: hypothetical protein COU73_03065 [Parcubacteria group bacterium CG10_big_fil_rev_8_21_14_0_10_46_32]